MNIILLTVILLGSVVLDKPAWDGVPKIMRKDIKRYNRLENKEIRKHERIQRKNDRLHA